MNKQYLLNYSYRANRERIDLLVTCGSSRAGGENLTNPDQPKDNNKYKYKDNDEDKNKGKYKENTWVQLKQSWMRKPDYSCSTTTIHYR